MYADPNWHKDHVTLDIKKCHAVDFHCVHSGTGLACSTCGLLPGSYNDVKTAKASKLCTHTKKCIASEHEVLADLACYNIGEPYSCWISFQSSYTALESQYNSSHVNVQSFQKTVGVNLNVIGFK